MTLAVSCRVVDIYLLRHAIAEEGPPAQRPRARHHRRVTPQTSRRAGDGVPQRGRQPRVDRHQPVSASGTDRGACRRSIRIPGRYLRTKDASARRQPAPTCGKRFVCTRTSIPSFCPATTRCSPRSPDTFSAALPCRLDFKKATAAAHLHRPFHRGAARPAEVDADRETLPRRDGERRANGTDVLTGPSYKRARSRSVPRFARRPRLRRYLTGCTTTSRVSAGAPSWTRV